MKVSELLSHENFQMDTFHNEQKIYRRIKGYVIGLGYPKLCVAHAHTLKDLKHDQLLKVDTL